VREHDWVIVNVYDAALWRDGLGHLVGVARRRDPGADVEELADPRVGGQKPDHPAEERTGRGADLLHHGGDLDQLPGGHPVGLEVVPAADQVIPDSCHVRHCGIDAG